MSRFDILNTSNHRTMFASFVKAEQKKTKRKKKKRKKKMKIMELIIRIVKK